MNKFPSFSQWKQIFKVLKKGEKIALLVFSLLLVGSLVFLVTDFYISHTKSVPAIGGIYHEGVVGQPRFVNPIYGETNDIDRTLIDLVFSGLMTYGKDGKITTDLADSYHISNDGKTYDFQLKNNISWHDGKPLTADDIVFTIQTIQSADYKSPLRANWINVSVEKTSDKSVRFTLKSPYNSFLENCTVKIIPKHIWSNILPENTTLSFYNLQPIGSGPYQFLSIAQSDSGFINTFTLQSNHKYYNQPAFISNIVFHFFQKKEDLLNAANAKQIDGFTLASLEDSQSTAQKAVHQGWSKSEQFSTYSFSLPRYFAIFFNNQKASLLADSNIRRALSFAVNKNDLLEKISTETKSNIAKIDSPILPDFYGYQPPSVTYNFNTDQANALLDKSGFKNVNGQRQKDITKKPAFQFKSYLKVGSKGTEVTQLQACLTKLPNTTFADTLKNETNGTYGKATEQAVTDFQVKYLPDLKPTGETGKSTRDELNKLCTPAQQNTQLLKFTLTTVNQPQLIEVANMIKTYWQNVGVVVDINAVSTTDIKTIIKNRSYDALLYGEALGAEPDLYPFWHSSQIVDPGLNLSSYQNKDADQLLKDARETTSDAIKEQKYETLQNTILSDTPAIFLYNPDYIYWVLARVQGIDTQKIIDPAKRFENITNWYIDTKRVWK